AIRGASARLADARRSGGERGAFSLCTTPRGALELLLLAVLPSAALLALQPQLMAAWHGTMLWWSERLALPLGLVRQGATTSLEWQAGPAGALVPDALTGVVTAAAMTGHLATLLNAGFCLMLALPLPLLLALGRGVLRVPLHQKLLCPVLVMAYFAVMLPHQALLHAVVVQHFPALFMPLLYLCFCAVLDLMVLVALCAWLASLAQAPGASSAR
ncbi:MAG: hypothetical protein WA007_01450, partial [Hydrogenophaga sp.]